MPEAIQSINTRANVSPWVWKHESCESRTRIMTSQCLNYGGTRGGNQMLVTKLHLWMCRYAAQKCGPGTDDAYERVFIIFDGRWEVSSSGGLEVGWAVQYSWEHLVCSRSSWELVLVLVLKWPLWTQLFAQRLQGGDSGIVDNGPGSSHYGEGRIRKIWMERHGWSISWWQKIFEDIGG